jgi:hypothetical protein
VRCDLSEVADIQNGMRRNLHAFGRHRGQDGRIAANFLFFLPLVHATCAKQIIVMLCRISQPIEKFFHKLVAESRKKNRGDAGSAISMCECAADVADAVTRTLSPREEKVMYSNCGPHTQTSAPSSTAPRSN